MFVLATNVESFLCAVRGSRRRWKDVNVIFSLEEGKGKGDGKVLEYFDPHSSAARVTLQYFPLWISSRPYKQSDSSSLTSCQPFLW